jgi:hypothetical protein
LRVIFFDWVVGRNDGRRIRLFLVHVGAAWLAACTVWEVAPDTALVAEPVRGVHGAVGGASTASILLKHICSICSIGFKEHTAGTMVYLGICGHRKHSCQPQQADDLLVEAHHEGAKLPDLTVFLISD